MGVYVHECVCMCQPSFAACVVGIYKTLKFLIIYNADIMCV